MMPTATVCSFQSGLVQNTTEEGILDEPCDGVCSLTVLKLNIVRHYLTFFREDAFLFKQSLSIKCWTGNPDVSAWFVLGTLRKLITSFRKDSRPEPGASKQPFPHPTLTTLRCPRQRVCTSVPQTATLQKNCLSGRRRATQEVTQTKESTHHSPGAA